MHHALEIQEILLNILAHCRSRSLHSGRKSTSDLSVLARTCRAFKEPALDLLWEELDNLSPLVRCLQEASCQLPPENDEQSQALFIGTKYSFSRPLTQTEWDILRGYACRIRSMVVEAKSSLDEKSLRTLSHTPTAEPLFPNLRDLLFEYTDEASPLLRSPLPSLISLGLVFKDMLIFQSYLASFTRHSPSIKRLSVRVRRPGGMLPEIEANLISRWRGLQDIICPQVTLSVDALAQLSRMPALTRLSFKPMGIATLPASDSTLVFPNLRDLTLHSPYLATILRLLSHIQLPTITDLTVIIGDCPSKQELSSFLSGVHICNAGRTIESLALDQSFPMINVTTREREEDLLLTLECLQLCMAFTNLRSLNLNIEWSVDLPDGSLLTLASAWPHLEHLTINASMGWGAWGGITPDGLIQLLRTCPSLRCIALAMDTRGYTTPPARGWLTSLGLTLPCTLSIDVLDSMINAKCVLAVATFFAEIKSCTDVLLTSWRGVKMMKSPGWEVHKMRWENVFSWPSLVESLGGVYHFGRVHRDVRVLSF